MNSKILDHWIAWQRTMADDALYTRENITWLETISRHTTQVPYNQSDINHEHIRLHLDDELGFVDLLYAYQGTSLQYLLCYVDTEFLSIPIEEN